MFVCSSKWHIQLKDDNTLDKHGETTYCYCCYPFNIYRHFVLTHLIVMVEQLSGGYLSDLSASTTTSHKLMKLKKNWELKPPQQNWK